MADVTCPVRKTIDQLNGMLDAGRITSPRGRRRTELVLSLLGDIARGAATLEHVTAMEALCRQLVAEETDDACRLAGGIASEALEGHRETFLSHITSRNCETGECVVLAPAPCQMTCPAGIDIPSYVTLIGLGRDAEAIEIIRRDNPFPWVCGLVCTRPCEFMCVRGRIDTPVSIKFLKAFAAERALSEGTYKNPAKAADKNRKVCVIGAGPGGLTAAYYLALKGYSVRVIESLPMAGGMMMIGIPRYRLPREVIDREVAMIEALGVTFCYQTRFGEDVTLDQLRAEGFEAFFFAIGAHRAYKMNIPGEEAYAGVMEAIDVLKRVALGDRRLPGKRVVVIGGGNVAIDAARTCLRLGSQEVTIAYRRTRNEMPADEEEVEQAEEEGVRFAFLTIPVEVVGKGGRLEGLKCLRAELVAKAGSSRMTPVPVADSEHILEMDAVITAIGQRVDEGCMASLADLKWTRRNTVSVDMANMTTSMEGVFAGGDAVTGPATVVEAIGGGKRAAEAIDRYLSGIPQPKNPPVPVRRAWIDCIEVPSSTKMTLKKPDMPLLNIDRRRTTFQQVELGYTENMVREEARRCLRCDICRRCGDCVAVCRDKMGINALNMGYLDFDHPVPTDFRLTAERCILCGACAANCPNGAMVIRDDGGERTLALCGTVLNREKLEYCDGCGTALGPAKYHDYVRKRIETVTQVIDKGRICEECARKTLAKPGIHKFPI